MISVWFACKSCGSRFSCRTVDEFLDHKKENHFSEFQKTQFIIFEELKTDEILARVNEHLEVKLFKEDKNCDIVLNLGTDTDTDDHSQIFGEIPEPSEFYDVGGYEAEIKTETETLIPSAKSVNKSRPVPPTQPTQVKNKNIFCVTASSKTETKNLRSSSHFPIAISDEEDDEHNEGIQLDPFENLENTSSNFTSAKNTVLIPPQPPNPYVLIKRLTSKQLQSAIKTRYKSKREIKTAKSTSASAPPKKDSLGKFVRGKIRRQRSTKNQMLACGSSLFKCPYLGCRASFKNRCKLERHETCHQNAKLNPKSLLNRPYFIFPEPQLLNQADPSDPSHTLREWLLEQKLSETKKSSNPDTETGTVNIIRLDPDPTETDLDAPIKITAKSPIKCKLCTTNLESETEVRVHVAHCWLENKQRHRYCLPCEKTFCGSKVFRKHHQKFHILGTSGKRSKKDQETMLRRYLCHLCPMRFKTSCHLKRHLERHVPKKERAKPFVCEICGAAFSDKFCFKTHISTVHSEIRPFSCPHFNCHAASKTKKDLNTHLKSHSATKPFSCPKEGCFKSYKTKAELGTHLKSVRHTGVSTPKSWKCDVESCKKKYSAKSSLDKHMIVVHGASGDVPRFECDICKKVFPWKVSLLNHGRTHT